MLYFCKWRASRDIALFHILHIRWILEYSQWCLFLLIHFDVFKSCIDLYIDESRCMRYAEGMYILAIIECYTQHGNVWTIYFSYRMKIELFFKFK